MTSRQRPRKQIGRLSAIVSALALALTVVSPTVPVAFAADDDLLAEWSFSFTVTHSGQYAATPPWPEEP